MDVVVCIVVLGDINGQLRSGIQCSGIYLSGILDYEPVST